MTALLQTPVANPPKLPTQTTNGIHAHDGTQPPMPSSSPNPLPASATNGSEPGLTNGVHADPFSLKEEYAYTPRKLKVFTIGAGFSGLLLAHKFQHRFPEMRDIVEHKIFEARKDVGGTWLANDYPGVQCDVPAHIYVSIFPTPSPSFVPLPGRSSHRSQKHPALTS